MNQYQTLYNLVNTYIFNNGAIQGSYEELMCVLVATCGTLALIAIPFYVVYAVIRLLTRYL